MKSVKLLRVSSVVLRVGNLSGWGGGAWDLNLGRILHLVEHQLGTWTQADLSSNPSSTIQLQFFSHLDELLLILL